MFHLPARPCPTDAHLDLTALQTALSARAHPHLALEEDHFRGRLGLELIPSGSRPNIQVIAYKYITSSSFSTGDIAHVEI